MNQYQSFYRECPSGMYSKYDRKCIKSKVVQCSDNVCRVEEIGYDNRISSYMEDRRTTFQKVRSNPLFKIILGILKIFNLQFIIIGEIFNLDKNKF